MFKAILFDDLFLLQFSDFQYDVYLQTYIEQNERKVNGKHLKAILPGLILLFGYGAHLIWGINHMEFDDEHSSYQLRDVMLIVYYSGGIGGAFIGAGLVTIFHKKNIYVSEGMR